MEDKRSIRIFLDDDPAPFAEFTPPVKFVFDSTKIPDGKHELKIVAVSSNGKEGVKRVPFEVRNGPSISVIGLNPNEVVSDQIPITVNAYGSERSDLFIVTGSENPKGIPAWIWALMLVFIGFALYYLIMYLSPDFYKSFV